MPTNTGTYQYVLYGPKKGGKRKALHSEWCNNKRESIRKIRNALANASDPEWQGAVYRSSDLTLIYQAHWDGHKIVIEEL